MSRRIEVELTSNRDDGTWTWRAAGAKQPKGELDGRLLPSGAKVGDVLRADADFDIEGITVTAVLPPKGRGASPSGSRSSGPSATSSWSRARWSPNPAAAGAATVATDRTVPVDAALAVIAAIGATGALGGPRGSSWTAPGRRWRQRAPAPRW